MRPNQNVSNVHGGWIKVAPHFILQFSVRDKNIALCTTHQSSDCFCLQLLQRSLQTSFQFQNNSFRASK